MNSTNIKKFNNQNIEVAYTFKGDSRELDYVEDYVNQDESETHTPVIVRFSGVDESGNEVLMTAGTPDRGSLGSYIKHHKGRKMIENTCGRCEIYVASASEVSVAGVSVPERLFAESHFRKALAEKEKAAAYASGTKVLNWGNVGNKSLSVVSSFNPAVWTFNGY